MFDSSGRWILNHKPGDTKRGSVDYSVFCGLLWFELACRPWSDACARVTQVMLTRLTTGELALCYNGSPKSRDKLRVAMSPDAKSWYNTAELEPGRAGLNFG